MTGQRLVITRKDGTEAADGPNEHLSELHGPDRRGCNFYRVVFGTVELPIVCGHILMGRDALESMGHKLVLGANVSVSLEPDTREDTVARDRAFVAMLEMKKLDIAALKRAFEGR